jgi:hypothetical protein
MDLVYWSIGYILPIGNICTKLLSCFVTSYHCSPPNFCPSATVKKATRIITHLLKAQPASQIKKRERGRKRERETLVKQQQTQIHSNKRPLRARTKEEVGEEEEDEYSVVRLTVVAEYNYYKDYQQLYNNWEEEMCNK